MTRVLAKAWLVAMTLFCAVAYPFSTLCALVVSVTATSVLFWVVASLVFRLEPWILR